MEGFSESRLPKFTKDEQIYIQGRLLLNWILMIYVKVCILVYDAYIVWDFFNIFIGAYDFFGLNQYSAFLVESVPEPDIGSPSWEKDMATRVFRNPAWMPSASSWLYVS